LDPNYDIQVTVLDLDEDGVNEVLLSIGDGVSDMETAIFRVSSEGTEFVDAIWGQSYIQAAQRGKLHAPFGGQGLSNNYTYIDGVLYADEGNLDSAFGGTEAGPEEEYYAPDSTYDAYDYYDDSYIFPDSDWRMLTAGDLMYLDETQLRLARNEIYARHGYTFVSEDLQAYFGAKSWYMPLYDNAGIVLNDVETANVELIKQYEQ
jgi:hypothetical protein